MGYTPGPWHADGVLVDGPDGMLAECGFGLRDDEEMRANARLIAAAPDVMRDAAELVRVIKLWRGWEMERFAPEVRRLETSLARARGPGAFE